MATIETRNRNQEQQVKESGDKRGLARAENAAQLAFTSPFSLMNRLFTDMSRLMAEGFGSSPQLALDPFVTSGRAAFWVPAIEVFERAGKLVIRAEVPGMSKDQINVEIDDNVLILSGERVQERDETQGNFYRSERGYGGFSRAIVLPRSAKTDQADASFSNGVLEITVPLAAQPEAKRLPIKETAESKNAEQANQAAQASPTSAQRANP